MNFLVQMIPKGPASSIIQSFNVTMIFFIKKAEINKLIQYILKRWFKEHPGVSVLLPGYTVLQ